MTTVVVNGEARTLPDGATVAELVEELVPGRRGRGLAVALDAEVLPRDRWEDTPLADGAKVEVVMAIGGG